MKKMILLLIALLIIGCTYDPPTKPTEWYNNPTSYTDNSSTHPRRQLFQAYLDSAVTEGLPGAVLLIRTPQEGTWVGVSGYADIANHVPWQPSTMGRIGSVSKLYAATAILLLHGDSYFELDELANPYLPNEVVAKVANAGTCTIRHLLNHTSGIYNYLESIALVSESYGSYRYAYQPKEKLIEYAYHKDAEYALGNGWNYSNTNFLLLEMIAERVTGVDSRTLLDSLIFKPLRLPSTLYNPNGALPRGLARGYADFFRDGKLIDVTDTEIEHFHYDGGIISTVYDLADFIDALFQSPFLGERLKTELTKAAATNGRSERGVDYYGSGIILEKHPQFGNVWGHSGTATGYTAHVYHLEQENITIAALVNGSQGTIADRSYKWFSPLKYDKILRLAVEGN